jgi:cobalt-zinc-cadmium efflux system outer membrane protein
MLIALCTAPALWWPLGARSAALLVTQTSQAGNGPVQSAAPRMIAPGTLAAPLTLEQVLRIVLERHPLVVAARQEVNVARGLKQQAAQLPSPTLSYDYSKVTNAGAVSELLEFPGKRRLREQAAELDIARAEDNLRATQSSVAFQARQAFLRLLLADGMVATARQTVADVRQIRDAAEDRNRAGDVAQLEVIRGDVELAQAQQQQRLAEGNRRVAELSLNLLLGRAQNAAIAISGDLAATVSEPGFSQMLSAAYARQPEIAAAEALAARQERELEAARKSKFPDLDLGFSYGTEDTIRTPGVHASVAIPLPGRVHGLTEQYSSQRLIALAQLDDTRSQVTETLASAYQNWLAAREQVRVYQTSLLAESAEALRTARESYTQGETGIVNLLDAERTDLTVRQDYQSALYDMQLAVANLILTQGGIQ